MDAKTGKLINGETYIRQSIERILLTPLMETTMRPSFGSKLIELKDAPLTDDTKLSLFAAVAEALAIWFKPINLKRVQLETNAKGQVALLLNYEIVETGQSLEQSLNIPKI